jgi:hypothetical protein
VLQLAPVHIAHGVTAPNREQQFPGAPGVTKRRARDAHVARDGVLLPC